MHEALKISETQETFDKAASLEAFEVVEVFSCTNEDDRTFCCSNSGKSTTTLSVSIKFGDNDLSDLDCVMESLGLCITGLTYTSVHHEDGGIWFDCGLHLQHLVEERLLLLVSS